MIVSKTVQALAGCITSAESLVWVWADAEWNCAEAMREQRTCAAKEFGREITVAQVLLQAVTHNSGMKVCRRLNGLITAIQYFQSLGTYDRARIWSWADEKWRTAEKHREARFCQAVVRGRSLSVDIRPMAAR